MRQGSPLTSGGETQQKPLLVSALPTPSLTDWVRGNVMHSMENHFANNAVSLLEAKLLMQESDAMNSTGKSVVIDDLSQYLRVAKPVSSVTQEKGKKSPSKLILAMVAKL